MSVTQFEKSLIGIIKGIHTIEEFSERILRGAVYETIDTVAQTYGLNAKVLKDTLGNDLIRKHSAMLGTLPKCKAITYRGKRCTHDAVDDGHCAMHARQLVKPKKRTASTRGPECCDDVTHKIQRILTSATQRSVASRSP